MDLKSRKGVRSLGFVGIGLLLIAGFMLVLQPLFAQNAKFTAEITAAEAEQTSVLEKLELLRYQRDTIEEVEKLDDELSKEFPGTANTPALISTIAEAANDAGMGSNNITNLTAGIPSLVSGTGGTDAAGAAPAPAAEGAAPAAAPTPDAAAGSTNLAEITLDISVEGDVDEVSEFVNNLRDADRNLTILSFNLASEAGESGNGKTTATVSAKTYIYKSIPKIEKAPVAEVAPEAAEAPQQ